MVIFIEYFSLRNFMLIFYYLFKHNFIHLEKNKYYYIDSSFLGELIIIILNIFDYFNFQRLNFKLAEIKDLNNELVSLRLEIMFLKI